MQETICFVAHKSGGHIFPCLALADMLKKNNPQCKIIFFTGNSTLDTNCIQQQSIDQAITLSIPTLSKNIFATLYTACSLLHAFFISLYYLMKCKPTKIISTGGLIALPVCLAGALMRIPIALYELNAKPGKAITFLAPYAQELYSCFQQTQRYFPKQKCLSKPYPIRSSVYEQQRLSPSQARAFFGLDPDLPTIALLGGSQGSQFLNKLMVSYQHDDNFPVQFIHQTGAADTTDWKSWYQTHALRAYVCAFEQHIASLYSSADIIICRSGSGILHEVLFFGKQCITIPLPVHITDHQLSNAQACAQQYPDTIHVITQEQAQAHPEHVWKTAMSLLQAM